ncbi:MAG: hypothetical protein HRT88_02455 [Lentisphaeraceae bacterium]|nr:hypothetical protein [Lentisphaeraceae bacterium]
MNNELSIEHDGEEYTAEYYSCGGSVTIILPNGNMRVSELTEQGVEHAVRGEYLKAYTEALGK